MSSSLLTPDPGLIFWMLIAFGIVLFILSKYEKLDSRKHFIDDSLAAAQQAFDDLEQVRFKNERLIKKAKEEQILIISKAAKKRDLILENAHEKAMKETYQMIENARKQIQQEKEEALTAIRREIAIVSVDIAEKVLRENLKEKEKQMSMIERLIDEINIS